MGLSSLFTSIRPNRHHPPHDAHSPHHHVVPSPPPPPPHHSPSPPASFRFSPPRRARHSHFSNSHSAAPSPAVPPAAAPRSIRHFRRLRQHSSMSPAAAAASSPSAHLSDPTTPSPSVSSRRVYSVAARYAAGYDPSRPDHYPTSATPEYISMDSSPNLPSSPPSPTFLPQHTPVTDRPKPKSDYSANSSSSTTVSSSHNSGGGGGGTPHRRRRYFSDFFRGSFSKQDPDPNRLHHHHHHHYHHHHHQPRPRDKARHSDEDGPISAQPSDLPNVLIDSDDLDGGPISLPLPHIPASVDVVRLIHPHASYDAMAVNGEHDPTKLGSNSAYGPQTSNNNVQNDTPLRFTHGRGRHIYDNSNRPSRHQYTRHPQSHVKPARKSADTPRIRPDRPAPISQQQPDTDSTHPFRVPSPSSSSPVLYAPPLRLPQTMEPPSERVSTDSGTQRTSDDLPSVSNGSVPSSPAQRMPSAPTATGKPRRVRPRPPPLKITLNNSPGFSRGGYSDERHTAPNTPRPTTPIISPVQRVIPKSDEHPVSSVTEDSDANDSNSPCPPQLAKKSDASANVGGGGDMDEPIAYTGDQMSHMIKGVNNEKRNSRDDMKIAGMAKIKADTSMDLEPMRDMKNCVSADMVGPGRTVGGGWSNELNTIPQHNEADEVTEDDFRFESNECILDGGFIIHESGLIEPPEHVSRKMSDGLAVEGIPTSSNKLIIVRSLSEFQESFVFKSNTQSSSSKESGNGMRKTLGRGAAGRVYLAVHKPSKRKIAVKEINFLDTNKREQLRKELVTLISHQSRFLVKSYGAFYDDKGRVHVTLEYMDRGSLADAIRRVGKIPENVVVKIAEHCLRGLHFLHSNHILHRDVKTGNILLSQKLCRAKLSDFGLARDLKEGQDINSNTDGESNSVTNTFVGTMAYMSPERLKGKKYTYASDIWALGISILECVLGRSPFVNMQHFFDYVEAAVSIPADLVRGQVSDELYDFLRRMTDEDENNRPRASELLQHKWIVSSSNNSPTFRSWLRSLPQLESGKRERDRERRSRRERDGGKGMK